MNKEIKKGIVFLLVFSLISVLSFWRNKFDIGILTLGMAIMFSNYIVLVRILKRLDELEKTLIQFRKDVGEL